MDPSSYKAWGRRRLRWLPRESGGIGRRASLRSWCPQGVGVRVPPLAQILHNVPKPITGQPSLSTAAGAECRRASAATSGGRFQRHSIRDTWTGSSTPLTETACDSDALNSSPAAEIVSTLAKISPPCASAAILAAL